MPPSHTHRCGRRIGNRTTGNLGGILTHTNTTGNVGGIFTCPLLLWLFADLGQVSFPILDLMKKLASTGAPPCRSLPFSVCTPRVCDSAHLIVRIALRHAALAAGSGSQALIPFFARGAAAPPRMLRGRSSAPAARLSCSASTGIRAFRGD
jgi:hypothetical protein